MFSTAVSARTSDDDEGDTAERQRDEDEERLQREFGEEDTAADGEQPYMSDAEMPPLDSATEFQPQQGKKRRRQAAANNSVRTFDSALPPLPASAPQPPLTSSSKHPASSFSSSSRASRIPPRPSRVSSALASSDRAEMESSLSAMSVAGGGRVKKKGRPLGSTADRLPPELTRRMGEANGLFVAEKYEACEQLLKSIIKQSPLSLAPYHTLALVYESQGDTRRFCDTLQVVAELSPKDASNWATMARAARQLDEVALAERAVSRAVALSGGQLDDGLAWIKGWVELEKSEWKKAVATWSWLMERERRKAGGMEARCMLVRSLKGLGDTDQATLVLEDYIQAQRHVADTAAEAGHLLDSSEQRSRAREQKRTEDQQRREQRQHDLLHSDDLAFDSDTDSAYFDSDSDAEDGASAAQPPLNLELVTELCWLYSRQHLYHKVEALMESIASLLPTGTSLSLELRCLHAVSLLLLGQTQRATIQLNRLLDVNFHEHPNFLPLLELTADAYRRSSLPQTALSAYRLLSLHAPYTDDTAVWVQMAACLRSVGTTEEEWREAKELYERALAVDEGNAEARIGLRALRRETEEEKEEEEEEQKAERAAPSKEGRERKPRRRPAPAEPVVERPLPELPEEDISITHLLQTLAQLSALEEQARECYQRKDYASLIAHTLPILQRTMQVASGNNPQPPPPAALSQHHPMPRLEDERGRPVWSPAAYVAPPLAQLTRNQRVAASRLLLSRAAFQTTAYVVKALSSRPALIVPTALVVPASSGAAQSAHLHTAVQLVGDLSTHYQLKRAYSTLDADCPRLMFGALYKLCVPLLLALDQTHQAYSYCQQMLDRHNSAEAADEDLDVAEVVGAVLRRMGYPRKVRRWLTILREKGSGHEVAVRVLLAHSWYSHRGCNTAARLYHQALALMLAMGKQRQQATDWQRMRGSLYLYLSFTLLHRALSVSSRMKPHQKQQQPAQLLRSLAYITAYHGNAATHTAAVRAWNVGRWHQAARYDAQATRWYERVLDMEEEAESEEAEVGGVAAGRLNVRRRAAECLALVYKRSGNEALAARLYAEYQ